MESKTSFVQVMKSGASKYVRLPPEIQEIFGAVDEETNIRIECSEKGKATITIVK